jgi:hypothetical protein
VLQSGCLVLEDHPIRIHNPEIAVRMNDEHNSQHHEEGDEYSDVCHVTQNDQLTDGGPTATLELPSGVAGPPFGGAFGSAGLVLRRLSIQSPASPATNKPPLKARITAHSCHLGSFARCDAQNHALLLCRRDGIDASPCFRSASDRMLPTVRET